MNFVCLVLPPASREKQTKLSPNLDSYKGEENKYEVSGMFWGEARIRCCCGWIATMREQFVSLGSKSGNLVRGKNERKKIFTWASVLSDAKIDSGQKLPGCILSFPLPAHYLFLSRKIGFITGFRP